MVDLQSIELDPLSRQLSAKYRRREALVGVMGLGYVGLPLLIVAAQAGFHTLGFDVDSEKIDQINSGHSYISAVDEKEIARHVEGGLVSATSAFERLAECDVICVCVPTPLTRQREPDLQFIVATSQAIASTLRKGQLIVLESTTYPGTTIDVVKPILESSGLVCGQDFYLGYSPEREDPGNKTFNTGSIPKVVSGDGKQALLLVEQFYGALVTSTVPVSNIRTAEVVKLTENIFRSVNIGLVNELKLIYAAMDIDIWEVIDAAKTKPFGFMPFYPGPGLGGHCIPVDPFYLTWKSREYSQPTRFIELAGEINSAMPKHVVEQLAHELDLKLSLPLSRASVLVLGVAYKKNVNDVRESPAFKIIELLNDRVADLAFHDPYVTDLHLTRNHPELAGMKSIEINADSVSAYDAVVVVTDHDGVNYELINRHARLILDTRNAFASRGIQSDKIVKA
jgi:UDP-N-acetyl-D-glucosamine dehydrogenase